MFQSLVLIEGGFLGLGGDEIGRIRDSGTIGNGTLPSISDVLYVSHAYGSEALGTMGWDVCSLRHRVLCLRISSGLRIRAKRSSAN